MGQLETSLLQETIYSLKFSLESEAVFLSLFSGLSGITFSSRRHSPNARASLFPLYEDWGLGFTTRDVVRYHVLPLHPGCPLQVSGKTQNRQLYTTVHLLLLHHFPTPPLYKRISWARALQLTGTKWHATVSPRMWQQRSLPSGDRFVIIESFLNTRLKCSFLRHLLSGF